jgi:hypothetical protein
MREKQSWKWLSIWPKMGVDMVAIPGVFFPFVLLSFVSEIARYITMFMICFYGLASVMGCKPARLLRRLTVSKTKSATPIWRKKVVMSLLAGFLFTQPVTMSEAMAEFRVIGVKQMMEEEDRAYTDADKRVVTYDIKGVGRDIKLDALLKTLLKTPWGIKYLSDELKDISISWAAPQGTTERALLADIARRYGLSFMASESEFLYYIGWDVDGVCDAPQKIAVDEANTIDKYNPGGDVPARRPIHTGRDKIQESRYVC